MKKIYVILMLLLRLFTVGFEKVDEQESAQDSQFKDTENINNIISEGNPYFSAKNHMYFKAQAEYDDTVHSKFVEEVVYAEMYLVKEYDQGSVYKFVVEPLGSLTDERLNTYFYVTNDKIYRLFSYVYQDNEMITFYDNDELLVEMLDTDEKLINNSQIVCQNEEVKSETKEGDIEFHFAISKLENQINYSSTTITPNGEIYYYESFVWEEGKGLIEFNSGYRAESEPLYLTEISEISEERYKKNRKAESTIQIFNGAEILMDVDNNTYVCCYEFSEDYYWDEMIMKDRMTAMLVKENKWYWAKRKSDSVENGVYHELF